MDAGAHELERPAVHGLVNARPVLALLLAAGVAAALATGLLGGLARLGIVSGTVAQTAWLPRAALGHAALMMCGFFGTVIGIERAVAARHRLAWTTPFAAALGGALLLAGQDGAARGLFLAAAAAFVAVNILLLRRQRAPHTALLLASAACWLAGNVLFAAGAASTLVAPVAGGVAFGLALFALALWLFAFDIARRTVRAEGLSRYMAVCLLGGYVWLAVGGLAWAATSLGWPARDTALHALGLGFIFSMIMGHAPVILPAIARVKLLFGAVFYLPLALLHASLLLRLAGGAFDFAWRSQGALLNAVAIAFFALVALGAAAAWRRRHGGRAPSRRSR